MVEIQESVGVASGDQVSVERAGSVGVSVCPERLLADFGRVVQWVRDVTDTWLLDQSGDGRSFLDADEGLCEGSPKRVAEDCRRAAEIALRCADVAMARHGINEAYSAFWDAVKGDVAIEPAVLERPIAELEGALVLLRKGSEREFQDWIPEIMGLQSLLEILAGKRSLDF